jgi:hypothetical protein
MLNRPGALFPYYSAKDHYLVFPLPLGNQVLFVELCDFFELTWSQLGPNRTF